MRAADMALDGIASDDETAGDVWGASRGEDEGKRMRAAKKAAISERKEEERLRCAYQRNIDGEK